MTDATRLAWRICVNGDWMVVFATTGAKARWIAVNAWREDGHRSRGEWPNIISMRAKHYDQSTLRDKPGRCWIEEYVIASLK